CESVWWQGRKTVAVCVARLRTEEMVTMNVDESRRHVHSGSIDHLFGGLVNRRRHLHDLVVANRYVHNPVTVVLRIDHMTILDENIQRLPMNRNTESKCTQEK